jgi:hypothetical protein
VTAPTPEKIERWVPSEGMDSLSLFPDLSGPGETEYVIYTDHLRHLKLAQIEVLEEMERAGIQRYGRLPYTVEFDWVGRKIAALRKEIEG